MKRLYSAVLLIAVIITGSVLPVAKRSLDPAGIEAYVRSQMAAYGVPGIQVCVRDRNGVEIVNMALGWADRQGRRPLDTGTRMKIGSNTKSFTAVGILILAGRGRIALDDPVGRYLDFVPPKFRAITNRRLMNMDSGLRGYINDDDEDLIIDRVIAAPGEPIAPDELVRYGFDLTDEMGMTPDGELHYTNTNYILLGMIIERVSGSRYADFIHDELIAPLGLHATYVPVNNQYGENVSKGYHFDKSSQTTEAYSDLDLSYVWSAGALISTAADLCRWIGLIGSDAVVSGNELAEVHTGLSIDGTRQYTSGLLQEPACLWHNGTVLGYHGEMRYLKASGTAIVVLSNCTLAGYDADPVKEIVEEITRQLTGDAPPA